MAGVGAREIKRQIKSVNSTMQITKAMELVSTSKLKKNKDNMEKIKPFFLEVLNTVSDILSNKSLDKYDYMPRKEINNSLIVVITSDRGLCGGYNSNAIKLAESYAKTVKNAKLLTIGKKATEYFSKRNYDVISSMSGISEAPKYYDATAVAKYALNLYLKYEIDEIILVYTRMISSLSQVATKINLIPVNIDDLSDYRTDSKKDKIKINYEPSAEVVMNYLVPKYVESVLYGALVEASAAEQASRRNAMESASKNAQELIDSLTLTYNQARQGAITQEINEIVGGANALEN